MCRNYTYQIMQCVKITQSEAIKMYSEMFPIKLKKARNDTGFTQNEVAKELKIDRSQIASYETGRTQPDIETLGKLADFYGVSVDWLIGTKGNKMKE